MANGPLGPTVADHEKLYRFITTPDWWVADEKRPSSAAFAHPLYSVNIASLITLEDSLDQLHEDLGCPNGGIVSFQCGHARTLGFDARHERDEQFPDNEAHAHVYCHAERNQRKKKARALAGACQREIDPSF
jgi:hypothetical protein